MNKIQAFLILSLISLNITAYSQADKKFMIFQFPPDKIPRMDGNPDDWEIVPDSYIVDGDQSGGPLIEQFHPNPDLNNSWDAYFNFHGVHAQNYHIFTPAKDQDWCLAWGGNTSTEQHPVHTYGKAGRYIVTLYIEGPDGKSHRSKVWHVAVRSETLDQEIKSI